MKKCIALTLFTIFLPWLFSCFVHPYMVAMEPPGPNQGFGTFVAGFCLVVGSVALTVYSWMRHFEMKPTEAAE